MDIPLPKQVALPEDVLFQEIENECVLLNMASEQYFGLDDVGARMWRLLVEHGDTQQVLTQLGLEYDADEPTLRHDLAAFIAKLQAAGLLATG